MNYTLIILLFSCGIVKAQVNLPARSDTDKLFYVNNTTPRFDSVAIHKYLVDGKPALTLSNQGESISCICLSKDDTGTSLTTLLRKKGSLLVCPWPYTRLEATKPTK